MKLFLILIMIGLFVLIGIVIYNYFLYRNRLYKDLIYICVYLKNNISFSKNEINVLLNDCCNHIGKISNYSIKNLNSNITFLKKDDICNIREFLDSLGKGDVDYEIKNLEYFESKFKLLESETNEKLQKNGLMYLKLIIGFGLIIGIILI